MGQGEIVAIEQDVLYPVVLCDERLSSSDAIFIFSRDDGEEAIAKLAADCYRRLRKNVLDLPLPKEISLPHDLLFVINGTTQAEWDRRGIKFGGTEMWRALLVKNNVRPTAILATGTAYHTGTEADELICIAKERMLKRVTIVAMPYHILRCFLTAIKAMEKAGHYLDVYNLTLPFLFWGKTAPKVLLDGSFEQGIRLDHIAGEHARIKEYTEKGFCATRDEAFAYLAKRGKR
jgi:hypothetical protein